MLWKILRGHRSAWFPLLSACRFVEFYTSIICHVLVHCFESFLLQDMVLDLQEFAFEGQNMTFTVNVLLTCILYCDAGPCYDWNCLQVQYINSFFFLRRRRSFTSRKLYACLEKFLCFLQLSDRIYVSGARCTSFFLLWHSSTTGFEFNSLRTSLLTLLRVFSFASVLLLIMNFVITLSK